MKLSVVVPCYNEAKNIPHVLERFAKALKGMQGIELILVNNNSTDDTQKVLKKLLPKFPFARSVFQGTPGYGAAIRKGLHSGRGEFLCYTHADLQTDPKDVVKAFLLIQETGNPEKTYVKGDRKKRPLADQFFTTGMTIFETVWLGTYLHDINAQPNMFHKNFLRGLEIPEDFSLDLYLLYTAKKKNMNIVRFKVLFADRLHGVSSWNTSWSNKWKFIKRTLDFSAKLKRRIK